MGRLYKQKGDRMEDCTKGREGGRLYFGKGRMYSKGRDRKGNQTV